MELSTASDTSTSPNSPTSSNNSEGLIQAHHARMKDLYGDEHVSKPFYKKLSFGYIVLIILYLCLGILHTITQIYPGFEHTSEILSVCLYFGAAVSYGLVLYGHWHEKEHLHNRMIRIAQIHGKTA